MLPSFTDRLTVILEKQRLFESDASNAHLFTLTTPATNEDVETDSSPNQPKKKTKKRTANDTQKETNKKPKRNPRLAPRRCRYSFTYPGRMENWVGLGGKESRTNIRILAEPGSNWGPYSRKAEILPTAPTMPALYVNLSTELSSNSEAGVKSENQFVV